ncbi:tape measure protein [Alistipes indistinctus]|uniref:tape measure protein n=1 Tax=Alistipes indistinctus TaxID=626932 RepID=UPI0026752601|nr:tape measure protein [Alistipes indistinctus]
MNGVQGAIHFVVTGDETDLLRALSSSRSAIIASGDTAEKEGAKIEQMFKRATSSVFAFFSAAQATSFVKSMATVHGEFQQIEIALETILGNEREAATLMNQLRETAAKTPFDMKGIANGAKQLLAYGEDAATVNETLIKLGNIAAGLSQPLGDLVYLYGTTMTQGRLYTQDFNQFVGRGIPMIKELAEYFGVAESEVRGLVEAGKVGFPEVQAVISSLTEEGGMFFNLMEKQSTSVIGKISNLGDAWDAALDKMGESSEGFIYTGIEGLTYLVEHYDTVLKILGTLVTAYGSYKAALIAINAIQKVSATVAATRALLAQTQMLTRATQAQILFNQAVKANPYVLAFSALTTVITALAMFCDKSDEAEESVSRLENANKKASEEFDKEAAKIKSLQDVVANANVAYDERKKALDKLREIVPEYNASLSKEGELVNNNTDAIKDYLVQLEKQIKLKAAQEELEEAYKEQRELQREWDSAREDLSLKRTNSAYYDKPIIDVAGMFGQRDLQKAEARFNDVDARLTKVNQTIASLNSEIATTSTETNGSTKQFKTFSEQLEAAKNKVTTLKAELKDLLAGKGNEESFVKAIEDKRKELKAAEDAYDTLRGIDPKSKKASTSSTTDYKTKIANEGRELERLYKDMELSIQRARIDAMDEGLEKVLAENELNHKAELEAIERQKEDTLRKIQEREKTIWESENPDWKKKGLTFTPTTTELPKDVASQFDALTKAANDRLVTDNKKALDDMLSDYMSYEQKRSKIKEEYDKKRQSLYNEDGSFRSGVSQGNVDELNRSETEALKAVDEEFAQREATYQSWMEAIANMTLRQLEAVLAKAEQELAELEQSGDADDSQMAVARAKVNTARKKVEKANADNDLTPGKRTIKEWEDLYKTLMEAEKEFESVGDAVEGTAGKIISSAGQIMTSTLSMINSIITLATTSSTGIQTAATASAKAIQTVEKASVILTIISAAMQVAMAIINLFNKDDEYQEEIERLQERIDQLQWELENTEASRLNENLDILKLVKSTYAEVTTEVLKLHSAGMSTWGSFYQIIGKVIYKEEILKKTSQEIAKTYANLEYTVDKALGEKRFDDAKNQLANIAQQQLLIQEQIRNEDAKKKTDHGKIADWERQIIELGEEANKIINDIVEEIMGGSAADLASELGDAFIEAFRAGEDAAEAWGEKVDDIVANVIKRMLVSKYLEEPLGDIFDKYKSKWYKDGEFAGIDAIMESMNGFANDLNAVGDEFQTIWDSLPDSIKNLITVTDDAREASERGIATASQESVDENNGRLTVIQGHTYTMNENVKLIVLLGDKILEAINIIRANTEYCKRLDNIDKQISSMRNKLDEIGDDGLRVK